MARFTISMPGFYRLGSRIGTVSRQGNMYIFTSLEPDTKLYTEVVPEQPAFLGYSWRDVESVQNSVLSEAQVREDIELCEEYLDDYLQDWDDALSPFSWVIYSPRYDEIVIDWGRAALPEIVKVIRKSDTRYIGKAEYTLQLLNRMESVMKTLTIAEVRGTLTNVGDYQVLLEDYLYTCIAKQILSKKVK